MKKKLLLAGLLVVLLTMVAYQFGTGEELQGKFSPSTSLSTSLTQPEALKMLVEDALGKAKPSSRPTTACTFSSVSSEYSSYYITACEKGWISEEWADPTRYANKEEISTAACKVYSVADYSPSTASFTDVSSSSTYYKCIEGLNHVGAFSSTSGTFGLSDTVTKAFMLYMTGHMAP